MMTTSKLKLNDRNIKYFDQNEEQYLTCHQEQKDSNNKEEEEGQDILKELQNCANKKVSFQEMLAVEMQRKELWKLVELKDQALASVELKCSQLLKQNQSISQQLVKQRHQVTLLQAQLMSKKQYHRQIKANIIEQFEGLKNQLIKQKQSKQQYSLQVQSLKKLVQKLRQELQLIKKDKQSQGLKIRNEVKVRYDQRIHQLTKQINFLKVQLNLKFSEKRLNNLQALQTFEKPFKQFFQKGKRKSSCNNVIAYEKTNQKNPNDNNKHKENLALIESPTHRQQHPKQQQKQSTHFLDETKGCQIYKVKAKRTPSQRAENSRNKQNVDVNHNK